MTPVDEQHFNYIYFLRQPVEMYPVCNDVQSPERIFTTIELLSTEDDQLVGWISARVIDRSGMIELYPNVKPSFHTWWIVDPHELVPDAMVHHVLIGVRDEQPSIYDQQ